MDSQSIIASIRTILSAERKVNAHYWYPQSKRSAIFQSLKQLATYCGRILAEPESQATRLVRDILACYTGHPAPFFVSNDWFQRWVGPDDVLNRIWQSDCEPELKRCISSFREYNLAFSAMLAAFERQETIPFGEVIWC